ncbi:MAG: hypothetical protein WA731_10105 [Pseudonocardiaceae bacterium]
MTVADDQTLHDALRIGTGVDHVVHRLAAATQTVWLDDPATVVRDVLNLTV